MRANKLRELLDDFGDVEVKIEVRGELEEPDGSILDIVDERSVYFYGQDGTVHIIGDAEEE